MAEQYITEQILVGAAKVYVSATDSTLTTHNPVLPAGTAGSSLTTGASGLDASTSWTHVGFTTGGVEFTYAPDFGEVEVDQSLDAAKMFKQRMTATVATTLAQASLDNLLIAWGQAGSTLTAGGALTPAPTDGETDRELGISSGDLGDEPVERALVFVGKAPRTPARKRRERVYFLRRALQVESTAHSLNRAEATGVPVSFRLLPDMSYSYKQYGYVRDRVIG
jgi:hypothetical protein